MDVKEIQKLVRNYNDALGVSKAEAQDTTCNLCIICLMNWVALDFGGFPD